VRSAAGAAGLSATEAASVIVLPFLKGRNYDHDRQSRMFVASNIINLMCDSFSTHAFSFETRRYVAPHQQPQQVDKERQKEFCK
jgi:hypothetical protein